jgi:hypothetical protein
MSPFVGFLFPMFFSCPRYNNEWAKVEKEEKEQWLAV